MVWPVYVVKKSYKDVTFGLPYTNRACSVYMDEVCTSTVHRHVAQWKTILEQVYKHSPISFQCSDRSKYIYSYRRHSYKSIDSVQLITVEQVCKHGPIRFQCSDRSEYIYRYRRHSYNSIDSVQLITVEHVYNIHYR